MRTSDTTTVKRGLGAGIEFLNPFPGLRPFAFEESHLFFGREGQSDEVLLNLSRHRFTAVIGASGSGKSSLMNCGLIPILHGGFMTNAGSDWTIITARPGVSPIENLARAIVETDSGMVADADDMAISCAVTATILRSSSMGLVDAVKQLTLSSTRNVFVLIDQFEELFRYIKSDKEADAINEASAFVNLMIKSITQHEVPIYMAITMRSDFIGDCSQFPELTHLVNRSHYLIPQMTRDQQRLAIEGPVAVGQGRITKRLVQQLLNDVGNNPDQLPVMQHALMRTWDYWVRNREPDEPVDLRHYVAVGRISEALSQHANEAYSELDQSERVICEILFKALTEKGPDNQGLRRSARLSDIAEIADVPEAKVIQVIDKFREPGRSLLMPPSNVPLTSNSNVEISHESLMRIWHRLKNWVEEEADSANMYRRLAEAAAMHQVGKAGLWRPPDLELAKIWRDKQNPRLAWAKRYNVHLEKAMTFLNHSQSVYDDELRQKERAQKRNLKTTRAVAVILGIAAVISILFFIYGWVKKVEADRQAEIAEINRLEAVRNAEEAEKQAEIAQIEAERARENERIAQANAEEAQRQREIAEIQRRRAELESKRAITNAERAELERLKAEESEKLALMERGRAVNEAQRADRLRMLSIAQSMAMKSVNVSDNDLKALLAYQAFSFNQRYQGSAYDNFIYDGLYFANKDKYMDNTGKVINQLKGHRGMVRGIAFTNDGKSFYTSGSDGKILMWDAQSRQYQTLWDPQQNQVNHVMKLSPDNKWLVTGSDAPYILAINLETLDSRKISGHQGPVTDILFIPGTSDFVSLSVADKTLRINNYESSRILKTFEHRITSLALNPAGNILAGGDERGTVYLWRADNLDDVVSYQNITNNPVYALEFHPRGHLLSVGDESGKVYVCRFNDRDLLSYNELTGQNSRINSIKFSRNGELLATASLDGSIQVWVLDNLEKMLPMAFKDHHEYVWCIEFTPDGDYLMAGTRSGNLKLWPTRLNLLAQDICQYLMRNMNRVEWNRYVGEDIPYERTCESAGTSAPGSE